MQFMDLVVEDSCVEGKSDKISFLPITTDILNTGRELTPWELEVGFNPGKYLALMEAWVSNTSLCVNKSIITMIDLASGQVRSNGLLRKQDYRRIQDIVLNPKPIRTILVNSLMYAFLLGKIDALSEVETGLNKVIDFAELDINSGSIISDEAIDFTKTIPTDMIDMLAIGIPRPYLRGGFNEVLDREKNIAFTLAGIFEKDTLLMLQQLLTKALDYTWSYDELAHVLKNRTNDYIEKPAGKVSFMLKTYFSDVYNFGKRVGYYDNKIYDFVEAFQYVCFVDENSRSKHLGIDTRIYGRGNPIWKRWWPPNGLVCRCTIIPVLKGSNYKVSELYMEKPDKDFGGLDDEV